MYSIIVSGVGSYWVLEGRVGNYVGLFAVYVVMGNFKMGGV